jgi:hypothetical protein
MAAINMNKYLRNLALLLACAVVASLIIPLLMADDTAQPQDQIRFVNKMTKDVSFQTLLGPKDVPCRDRTESRDFILKPNEETAQYAGPDADDFVCWCARDVGDPPGIPVIVVKHGQKVICIDHGGCLMASADE